MKIGEDRVNRGGTRRGQGEEGWFRREGQAGRGEENLGSSKRSGREETLGQKVVTGLLLLPPFSFSLLPRAVSARVDEAHAKRLISNYTRSYFSLGPCTVIRFFSPYGLQMIILIPLRQ